MTEYPKIDTLFERDPKTFVVDPTKLKSEVLGTISQWDVTEKIDGTNIRVTLTAAGEVKFGGRSDNAQIHADLFEHLVNTFPAGKLKVVLHPDAPVDVTLYGEGYGAGIQKGGGLYRPDKGFILFDVLVDGEWWLDREDVEEIANRLGIPHVPYLGRMTLAEICNMVQRPAQRSCIGTATAEGIVARPLSTLYDKHMRRIIIKLKHKDFVAGKR